jgi:protein KRI1
LIQTLLGEDYYDQEDDGEGLVDEVEDQAEDVVESEWNGEEEWTEETTGEDIQHNEISEDNLWYYCDSCIRPIRPGNMGYDCKECEDITVCHNCHSNKAHESGKHKMKKFIVADHESPPSDWQEILYDLKKKRTRDIAKGKFDELFSMEYEDVIAGDIPCRFKYTKVDSDSFGLSTEAILKKSDRELNSVVSLKNLHPYRKEHVMKRVRYHDKNRSRQ